MKISKTIVMVIIVSFIFASSAYAKDEYFTNQYGVIFTEKEYNFISDFYFEGYQDYMKISDYEEFLKSNIMNRKVKTIKNGDNFGLNDYSVLNSESFHETSSKSIKLSTACSMVCNVSIVAEWKKSPTIRSYDVIGAYLQNVKMNISPSTTLYYDDKVISSHNIKNTENGFGSSIKLPSTGENIKIVQTFIVEPFGTIHASYQHAKRTSSLSKSQRFTISQNGYGGVFMFDASVKNYYDAMGGVVLDI